jgi:amino acid adenylation domain-containing protein/non-ribosomal peptide synthase protein (TIGR01720 family)
MNEFDLPINNTLVQILQDRAIADPDKLALRFLQDKTNGNETITYGELDRRARSIAAKLQLETQLGDRVILLFPTGLDYVAAFFGCLYAGVIAVPAYPPESTRQQHQERLLSIIGDAKPRLLLTSTHLYEPLSLISQQLSANEFINILPKLLCVDAVNDEKISDWKKPNIQLSDIAFLQYTSGSTSLPKGVQVTHNNLVVNEELIRKGFGIGPSDVLVSWLPLYHDMGLIGCLLQSIYSGIMCVLMSPRYFLERPVRWLEAISEYKGTISGGPDFAYRLCSERIAESALSELDLSHWKIAFSGSEPIRQDSLDDFTAKFSSCGFTKNKIFSCYGLAEATLFVTGSVRDQGITALTLDGNALAKNRAEIVNSSTVEQSTDDNPINNSAVSTVMSCGSSQPDHAIRIVNPVDSSVLADNAIGEIWATGPSIANGYWRNPKATAESFVESDDSIWLRTGDLGFIRDGELFVTGRLKDMLIVRGQNLYPQDIERIVEDELEVVRKGRVAAFAISYDGKESIGIAAEVGKKLQKLIPSDILINNIREIIAQTCQEAPQQVALLQPGSLPKTSSGKLQRSACRQGLLDGSIEAYAIYPTQKKSEFKGTVKSDIQLETSKNQNTKNAEDIAANVKAIWCDILQIEDVDVKDHFFLLGGNSVLAVQVIAQCRERLHKSIGLRLLFDVPVFSEFVLAVETAIRQNKELTDDKTLSITSQPIVLQPRTKGLPLSSAQDRLWFLWQLNPQSIAYNIPAGLQLTGEINALAIQLSFEQLIKRHESLRTRFMEAEGGVLQYFDDANNDTRNGFSMENVDISMLSTAERNASVDELKAQEAQTLFDLTAGSLLRVKLIKLAQNEHLLLITLHHIIADGWSLNILMAEFSQLYAAVNQDKDITVALAPLTLQYADYASWQRQWLLEGDAKRQLKYWEKQLGGEQPNLQLTTDFPRINSDAQVDNNALQNKAARFSFTLDNELTNTLRSVAQTNDATLFMLLLASFQTLLHRYTGQHDIRVGVPSANRQHADIQNVVGFFINTLVLRTEVQTRLPFTELLAQVKQTTLDAQMHQDIPIDQVIKAVLATIDQVLSGKNQDESPLFQVMFNHQQRGVNSLNRLTGLSVKELPWHSHEAKCDLQLHSEENEQGHLQLSFDYNTALFKQETVQRLAEHFTSLLENIAKQPEQCIGDIPLLSSTEHKRLTRWSEVDVKAVNHENVTCLAERLNAQVLLTPEAIALQWDGGDLSYEELHTQANKLAHYLHAQGVKPEVRVAIMLERSPQLLIGLLAIIKAGGTYLPLDPDYPTERLSYMLSDSGAEIVLTESCFIESDVLSQLTANSQLIDIDTLELNHFYSHSPHVDLHSDNLAYIIYTSGSTGLPKGVGISHGALIERLQWMQTNYQFNEQSVFLQKAPVSFDVSVWECFLPLMIGSRLTLAAPGEQRDPNRILALVQQFGVTALHFVPPLLQLFIEEPNVNNCTSLRHLFSGGESLSVSLRDDIFSRLPTVELHNRYGPTETAINVTHWHCNKNDNHRSPIGKPLSHVICRVLDEDLMLSPTGVVGELYVGGAGLARGYLSAKTNTYTSSSVNSNTKGRAALTAECFVPDPLSTTRGAKRGARLYRTGDKSRWGYNGALDYLGRVDQQVKLRGFRIEPQEIEAQLLDLPTIRQAVVVVHQAKGEHDQLIAYYVSDDLSGDLSNEENNQLGNQPDNQQVNENSSHELFKTELEKILPSYMIPAQFIALTQIPLTVNGKVDHRALPEPNAILNTDIEYIEPKTLLAIQVASIWQEILGIKRIGLLDDFFQCGGHSLLATQIVSRTRLACNVELPLKILFENSELGAFVDKVSQTQQAGKLNSMPAIDIIDRNKPVPLSYSQKRLWFLWQVDPDSPAYNVGGMARLQGTLLVEHFSAALQALIQRHETLRTTFPSIDGVPVQQVAEHSSIILEQKDFSALNSLECQQCIQQLADHEAHQAFDLEKGPLLRACLVKVSEQEHVFALTLHHIVTEGWAMDIFAREIGELYEAFIDNKRSPLLPLAVQYLDYSVWQRQWLESGEGQKQLDYWQGKLGSEHPVLALPSDRPRPVVQSYKGGLYRFSVSDELAKKVREFNAEHGLTLFMTMTAALSVLLYRYSGQNDLRIGAPIANRIRPESEGLIGAFLNTQVLRCQLDGQMNVETLLSQLRDTIIEGQSHQDLPFDQLVDALQPPRSAAYNPLFQVMCNVQRWNFQQSRELAGMTVDYIVNDAQATKFDLNLEVTDLNDELHCCLTYSCDLFDEARIANMARHWSNLLTSMVNNPTQRIAELSLFKNENKLSQTVLSELSNGTSNGVLNEKTTQKENEKESQKTKKSKYCEAKQEQDEERSLCLSCFNLNTDPQAPLQYCIHDLFTKQAQETPNASALSFDGKTLTYAELDSQSNQLAWLLRSQGVKPEDYVGLALERSFDMVISLLAILKAGAAYVPLDPGYPIERLQGMIKDSGICLLLSNARLCDALGELPTHVKCWFVEEDAAMLAEYSSKPVPSVNIPAHQAYLIYTSGSTGTPKGVMVSHGEISMHCQAVIERFGMRSDDCELHFYSINFDAATERLLAPLLCGSHVVLRGQNQWGVEEICQLIHQYKVNTLGLTPSYGSQLAQWLSSREETLPIRLCITGGEMLTAEHLQRINSAFQPEYFFNAYGPTETVVMPLASLAPKKLADHLSSVPIGRLVGDRVAYILDTDLSLVPQGSIGELYVGGLGLARGYHQRKGLTAERFIPNPFTSDKLIHDSAGRLYRTGDLVRQGIDGLVEYVGRADYQVKIRGFRIELGEIEAKILAHQAVDETVVLALDIGGNKQLVAYVASREKLTTGLDNASDNELADELTAELKTSIKAQLPEYMVPAQWVVLSHLPTGPNGKLDRKALPLPDIDQNKQDYIAPETEQEKLLTTIWSDVLAVEKIGVNDNFFELGGDSILSIQVVSRARQVGLNFSPRDLFQHQSIQALAEIAKQQTDINEQCEVEQGLIEGKSALTPIQYWFFTLPVPNRSHWNQAVLLEPVQHLDPMILEQVLQQLVQHHDALRLVFNRDDVCSDSSDNSVITKADDATKWQATYNTSDIESAGILHTETVSDIAQCQSECERLFNTMQRNLNIQKGPLLRAVLVNEASNNDAENSTESSATNNGSANNDSTSNKQRLLLVIHHLVVDGVSWRILLEDLQRCYRQLSQSETPRLPLKTSAFSDWTTRLQRYASNESLRETLSWWQEKLTKPASSLVTDKQHLTEDFPCDHVNGDNRECYAKTVSLRLSSRRTRQLLQQAPAAYRTQVNDLLLTALTRTLCDWTEQSSVLVQLEGHGREELFNDIDLTRTVGWFTSAYPLRLSSSCQYKQCESLDHIQGLANDIKMIKEQLRAVPHKGLSYGVLSYLGDESCQAAMQALPKAQITFNYLGQFDQSFGKDALFLPLSESTGTSRDSQAPLPNMLSVDSQVYDNELIIRWTYSTERYDDKTIDTLANAYLEQLESVIEHCIDDELLDSASSRLTPSDFPLAQLTQHQLDTLTVPAKDIADIYPLTSMQEGLLLHTLLEPGTGMYYMQDRYRIHSAIDPTRFANAWQQVVARHETLRASFSWNAGETMLQVIHKPRVIDVDFLDWRNEDKNQHEQRLQALLKEEREAGFDLLNSPPFHLRLICLGDEEYWFMMSNHHILIDAWCRSILMNDFFEIYTALTEKRNVALPVPSSYRDYISWLQLQNVDDSRQWWQNNLQGVEQPTAIASDRPLLREHATESSMVVGDCFSYLTENESTRLQDLAQQHQLTANTFAQAAWGLVLRRLSGDREVLFGVTVAGRPIEKPEMQSTVGLFINSIPLRVPTPQVEDSGSVHDWLQQLLAHNLELREHEYLSLVDIQHCSEVPKGTPLFDSLFVFENAPVDSSVLDNARHFKASSDTGRTHTNFPLTAVCYPGDELGLHISYDQRYFDQKSIEGMLSEFKRLLLALVDNIHEPFSALPLLSDNEYEFLIETCNQRSTSEKPTVDALQNADDSEYSSYVTLFEAQVEKNPQHIVASCLDQQWNYHELNQYANRMSHTILSQGVTAGAVIRKNTEQPIALLAERSLNLLGMMIACFKSGAAYLPLDPSHPQQRIMQMMHNSRVEFLICDSTCFELAQSLLAQLPNDNRPKLLRWEEAQHTHNHEFPLYNNGNVINPSISHRNDPRLYSNANSLAYVIYTSGSTGVPKGVMVEQQGMLNNQLSKVPYLALDNTDVIAQTASQCFDISVWQFLTAPLFGGRVDIVPNDISHNPQVLLGHIQAQQITVLESVPSLIQGLLDEVAQDECLSKQPKLRWLLPTGEAMPPVLAKQWLTAYPHVGLINAYGPAECSDDVAFFCIDRASTESHYLPIGSPTDNNRLYLLDEALDLVPTNAIAELYIAGMGVGRGYSYDAKRTAETFIPDMFSEQGERLYRSGDLARRRIDGLLEYVGRIDQQVKIRGYRIELGEIEAQLHKLSTVHEAAVMVQQGINGPYLVSYIVCVDENLSLSNMSSEQKNTDIITTLKQSLAKELPDYMVPLHWQVLDDMPRNANGKIDRKALPEIDVGQQQKTHYIAPRNELEQTISDTWAEVLKVEQVGIYDNFFELGGHSLLATQIASRLQATLQRSIPLRAMFECLTVDDLAIYIDSLDSLELNEEKAEWLNDFMTELEDG